MAVSGYNYSIQNDTPNHRVNESRLALDVRLSAIITALDHVGTAGDVLTVWFKAQLSAGDHTILTGIVQSHSGDPLPEEIQNVLITGADLNVPMVQKGFPDYSGYPYFVDSVWGDCLAGQTSYLYLSFNKIVRIQGGCVETDAANKGDYFRLELTYGVGGPVVGQFVVKKAVRPGDTLWERTLPDCQPIPVGVYLRMAYVNAGPNDVYIISSYDLRRTPA